MNALTFDAAGNTYISDSFNGIVWKKTGPGCGAAASWVHDDLLKPNGIPPFGANGLQFNKGESALFVANTSTDLLVKIPVAAGTPGTPQAFTYGINGADGIVLDADDITGWRPIRATRSSSSILPGRRLRNSVTSTASRRA